MNSPIKKGIWILTVEHNDYDQHGEYFVDAWLQEPTAQELSSALTLVGENVTAPGGAEFVDHVSKGGGRTAALEEWWYFLKEI